MAFTAGVVSWYAGAARDLPWRKPGIGAYAVLVSEVMLQQTPVARVLPAYEAWLDRWPQVTALAGAEVGEAVRMWGRLGYPRRALRLHAAAVVVRDRFAGVVPVRVDELLTLPGVGDYTARAVAAFAHRQRHAVVDTNVRRVVARAREGVADAPVNRRALELVESLLPDDADAAATAGAALMELGALVCTARAPRCDSCPVRTGCAWHARGRPALDQPLRRPPAYAGSDRQVRGRLLALVRDAAGPVGRDLLEQVWDEPVQRNRALASLLLDGLLAELPGGGYSLPGAGTSAARVSRAGAEEPPGM